MSTLSIHIRETGFYFMNLHTIPTLVIDIFTTRCLKQCSTIDFFVFLKQRKALNLSKSASLSGSLSCGHPKSSGMKGQMLSMPGLKPFEGKIQVFCTIPTPMS